MTGPAEEIRPLAPIGPALAWQNRRLIAERSKWPKGALAACEEIGLAHPLWHVSYLAENKTRGFERPAGFYADRPWSIDREEVHVYGATAGELAAEIERIDGATRRSADRW
jgi:hypothetical protein